VLIPEKYSCTTTTGGLTVCALTGEEANATRHAPENKSFFMAVKVALAPSPSLLLIRPASE
jgi:hypothetical protein